MGGYSLGAYSVRGYGMPMTTGSVARDTLTRPFGRLQCERLQCEKLREANDNGVGRPGQTHPSFREGTVWEATVWQTTVWEATVLGYAVRSYGMSMTKGWVARETLTRLFGRLQCEWLQCGRLQCERLQLGMLQCRKQREANDNGFCSRGRTHLSLRSIIEDPLT